MYDANQFAVHATALRPTGAVALLGIGAVHSLQIVHAFESRPAIGVADGALIVASVAVAVWLLVTGDMRGWVAAGLVGVVAIMGYVLNHYVSATYDNQDVGDWRFVLDLAPLFVETALLVLSGFAMALVHADIKNSEPAIELERDLCSKAAPASRETTRGRSL